MSDPTFKQLPSIAECEKRIRQLQQAVGALTDAVTQDLVQMNETLKRNTALTDEVLDELALQIAFVMQSLRLSKPLHGGIAGPDCKVPTEVKTFSEAYATGGRQKLIDQRKAFRDAHGLPPTESPAEATAEAANGKTADDGIAATQAEAGFPKLITH